MISMVALQVQGFCWIFAIFLAPIIPQIGFYGLKYKAFSITQCTLCIAAQFTAFQKCAAIIEFAVLVSLVEIGGQGHIEFECSQLGRQYGETVLAGAVLLGATPCTAMVFVWSTLTKENPDYTVVQVETNDLIILIAFAPIVKFLLGVSNVSVPFDRLVLKPRAAKCRKEDETIVFSSSTENAAGTGGGTEEATLRDKIAGRDQNGAKGAAGQDIQKYCLIAV